MRNAPPPMPLRGLSQSDWGWIISTKKVGAANAVPTFSCGDIEIRTLDPLLAKQVLYQLSYTPGLFQKPLD